MIGLIVFMAAQAAAPLASAPAPVAIPACKPGIYLETGDPAAPQLTAIDGTAIESRKVSNLGGFMLTGGLSGLKVKSVLPGPSAAVHTVTKRPVFRFCFDPVPVASADGQGSAYVGATGSATAPADFRLIQFESKKQQREVTLAKTRMFRGSQTVLADSTYRFDSVEIAPGQFRVTIEYDLPPGEYGFVRGKGGAQLMPTKKGQPPAVGDPGTPVYAFGLTKG